MLDFGIARRLDIAGAGVDSDTFTATGTISGTLAYMAPELLRDRQADAGSDIWALGDPLRDGRRPPAFIGATASRDVSDPQGSPTPCRRGTRQTARVIINALRGIRRSVQRGPSGTGVETSARRSRRRIDARPARVR